MRLQSAFAVVVVALIGNLTVSAPAAANPRHPAVPNSHPIGRTVPEPPPVDDALVAKLDGLLSRSSLKGDHVGFLLMNARGAVLYARYADDRFAPASCRKILSTACALSLLGPTDRIATRVEAIGRLAGGILEGDLELVGGGDPSLDEAGLADLARQVAAIGIRQVAGRVVSDGSAFEPAVSRPGGWSDDDLAWYYAPPISAVEVDEDRVADAAAHGELDLAAPHPARSAARRFEQALAAAGISIDGGSIDTAGAPRQLLATHLSPPLADLVERTNKPSDNLYAELLLRQLAIAGPWDRQVAADQAARADAAIGATGSVGPLLSAVRASRSPDSWPSGPPDRTVSDSSSDAIPDTLHRALSVERAWLGFVGGSFRLVDGSGLSRYDLLTPRQIATVLLRMRSDPAFVDSLPIAGRDGTLVDRMVGTPAAGQVRAKTGSMSGVSTLAGYVGDKWIVVFMDNGHVGPLAPVEAVEDAICVVLASRTQP